MAESLNAIAGEIAEAWKQELAEGWDQISSFHKSQTKKISKQAALISRMRTSGELRDDDDMFEFLMEQLEDKIRNFAIAVANLTALTLEKAWNASVGVVWGVINKLLKGAGISAVPIPKL
ncbi:hypothetical protein PEL8287_00277 [Roseovarius litorisediminis]|uniref:Phasin protein n=1 Tax=Roseovarius litorisediminis TaxID=1312363 RepID=A0A1Y5R8N9_9RHOB|nr:hypothetical protein [Roseovarius litorisediminis]SLN11674.1 hypothetical protein PEL8287_00277 [Roseovarius litorisediminis]